MLMWVNDYEAQRNYEQHQTTLEESGVIRNQEWRISHILRTIFNIKSKG